MSQVRSSRPAAAWLAGALIACGSTALTAGGPSWTDVRLLAQSDVPGVSEKAKYDAVENELGRRLKKYAMIGGGILALFIGWKVLQKKL